MTNRATKLLAEARRFIESGEEANWAAAKRMWQANNEEGVPKTVIAELVGLSPKPVRIRIAMWEKWGSDPHRPRFTDAYMETQGKGVEAVRDMETDRVVRERPERIVEAIAKAPPAARGEIFESIARDPVLHTQLGAKLSEAAQDWKREPATPGTEKPAQWAAIHVQLQGAESRLKAALDLSRDTALNDEQRAILRVPVTRIRLLLDWIDSFVEHGDQSFAQALDDLLNEVDS